VRGFRHHRREAWRFDTDQKNSFEFKEGESILCEGLAGARHNAGAQTHAANFKSTDENGKDNPSSSVNDVTVRYVDLCDAGAGVKLTSTVNADLYPCQPLRRFALQHARVERVGSLESAWLKGGGRSLNLTGALDELVLEHLTLLGAHSAVEQESGVVTRSVLRNSLLRKGTYGSLRIRGDVAGLAQDGNVVLSTADVLAAVVGGQHPDHPGVGWDAAQYARLMQSVPDFSAA
jgi:hypothetical protein